MHRQVNYMAVQPVNGIVSYQRFPDCTVYQQSDGTKQFFTGIDLASLCLGAALHLIKSVESVCGSHCSHNKK